jgi:hypothetical protein
MLGASDRDAGHELLAHGADDADTADELDDAFERLLHEAEATVPLEGRDGVAAGRVAAVRRLLRHR